MRNNLGFIPIWTIIILVTLTGVVSLASFNIIKSPITMPVQTQLANKDQIKNTTSSAIPSTTIVSKGNFLSNIITNPSPTPTMKKQNSENTSNNNQNSASNNANSSSNNNQPNNNTNTNTSNNSNIQPTNTLSPTSSTNTLSVTIPPTSTPTNTPVPTVTPTPTLIPTNNPNNAATWTINIGRSYSYGISPISNARVQIKKSSSGEMITSGTTDSSGKFMAYSLPVYTDLDVYMLPPEDQAHLCGVKSTIRPYPTDWKSLTGRIYDPANGNQGDCYK